MREVVLNAGRADRPRRGSLRRFWLLTLAALALVALTVSLGRWQLSRAAQKEALQARIEAQQAYPPLDYTAFEAVEHVDAEMHRRVRLRGLWVPTQTVYLDNRQMHGRPGFFVLTPFALEGVEQTLMVQRGWVPRNFVDRAQLPPVQTPAGLVELEARIAPPPAQLFRLGQEEGAASPSTPSAQPPAADGQATPAVPAPPAVPAAAPPADATRIRQNLDLAAFRTETGLPLRTDVSLQQFGPASEGLDRDWPAPALGIEKHYGYAFQWFGLAALVTLLYVWFQFIAPRRLDRRDRHPRRAR